MDDLLARERKVNVAIFRKKIYDTPHLEKSLPYRYQHWKVELL